MTTLADQIIGFKPRNKLAGFDGAFDRAGAEIKQAGRFSLTDDMREACRNVVLTRPTTLIEALAYAKPPFDLSWFEWNPNPGERQLNAAQIKPTRVGAMLKRIGPSAWMMWTGWSYSVREAAAHARAQFGEAVAAAVLATDPGLGVSGLMLGIDVTQPIAAPSKIIGPPWFPLRGIASLSDDQLAKACDDRHNPLRYALKDRREREALEALDRRMGWKIREPVILKDAMVYGGAGAQAAILDVQEEIAPMLATLILMNSKNCVEVAAVEPPPKLNKARAKRGQPPLVSYSTVGISLSRARRNAAEAQGLSGEAMRLHKVRGHFKVRRTGVFWWNEFERGDPAKGRVEHDYEVSP